MAKRVCGWESPPAKRPAPLAEADGDVADATRCGSADDGDQGAAGKSPQLLHPSTMQLPRGGDLCVCIPGRTIAKLSYEGAVEREVALDAVMDTATAALALRGTHCMVGKAFRPRMKGEALPELVGQSEGVPAPPSGVPHSKGDMIQCVITCDFDLQPSEALALARTVGCLTKFVRGPQWSGSRGGEAKKRKRDAEGDEDAGHTPAEWTRVTLAIDGVPHGAFGFRAIGMDSLLTGKCRRPHQPACGPFVELGTAGGGPRTATSGSVAGGGGDGAPLIADGPSGGSASGGAGGSGRDGAEQRDGGGGGGGGNGNGGEDGDGGGSRGGGECSTPFRTLRSAACQAALPAAVTVVVAALCSWNPRREAAARGGPEAPVPRNDGPAADLQRGRRRSLSQGTAPLDTSSASLPSRGAVAREPPQKGGPPRAAADGPGGAPDAAPGAFTFDFVDALMEERAACRQRKDYQRADEIQRKVTNLGVRFSDGQNLWVHNHGFGRYACPKLPEYLRDSVAPRALRTTPMRDRWGEFLALPEPKVIAMGQVSGSVVLGFSGEAWRKGVSLDGACREAREICEDAGATDVQIVYETPSTCAAALEAAFQAKPR